MRMCLRIQRKLYFYKRNFINSSLLSGGQRVSNFKLLINKNKIWDCEKDMKFRRKRRLKN